MAKAKPKATEVQKHVGETVGSVEVVHENKLAKTSETVEESEESLGVEVFQTTPAVVTLRLGRTVNIGNFNSVRVEVGVSVPCYREQIDDAYAIANTWVAERLTQKLNQIDEGSKAKKQEKPVDF